ncbi:LuxR C-terminal-related transcriptional regulator [Frigoribacterium sp. 2-23]|uniref:LuxR C-terminal-related transcriptional regulator n=1 Tax=Frigoribacterium sp. 2-23 TaxID=3415006 RepID=UPI003C6EF5E5
MNPFHDMTVDPPTTELQPVDHRAALDAIEQRWTQIAPLQGARLRDAIRSIPEDEWRGRPRILLALAASHHSVGSRSRSAALPWFRGVAKAIDADPDLPLDIRAGYHVHLAATRRSLGDFVSALEHLDIVRLSLEGDTRNSIGDRISLSASFSLQLGLVRVHSGQLDQALFALSLANGLGDEHLSTAERVECLSALAYIAMLQGDYERSDEHLELAARLADGTDLMRSSFGALAQITRLHLGLERDEPGRRHDAVVADVRLASRGSDWEALGFLAEAHVCLIEGRHIEVLDLLGRITRLVTGYHGESSVQQAATTLRAETMRALGQPLEARRLAIAVTPTHRHVVCPARVIALVHLTDDEPHSALEDLEACLSLGDLHSQRTMAHVHTIAAAAHLALDDAARSDIMFDRALLSAGMSGTSWYFDTLPHEVLDQLTTRALARDQPQSITSTLEHMLGGESDDVSRLAEPLSDRELVIVRHLATGQTLGQIGNDLFISVNTVKSHVRSIYRKVQATSRREAMHRLRQLGLLGDD